MQIGGSRNRPIKVGLGSGYEFCCPWRGRWRFVSTGNNRDGTGTAIRRLCKTVFTSSPKRCRRSTIRGRDCRQRTATVEAAIMGTPFVMVYRVSALPYALGQAAGEVSYFAMVNLIAEEEVVPSWCRASSRTENIVAELKQDHRGTVEPRERMIGGLAA